ncbi:MAG: hypothetical protein ACR2KV_02750 [Solirubrobacteraceae bacterium]
MPLDRSGRPGLAEALGFLRRLREDPALAARAEELDPDDGLGPVLALAAAAGFAVSAEDLRRAHRVDWHLRRARYS